MADILDSVGMFGLTFGLADQIEAATEAAFRVDGLPEADGIESVIALGMGGSGIAGDVLALVAGSRATVPVVVSKQYELPTFVGPNTLVIACSASGNTEETLSATQMAISAEASVVAVTQGGALASVVSDAGGTVFAMDPSISQPRAAIGAVSIPPLVVLERLGLISGIRTDLEAVVRQVRVRCDELAGDDNAARTLARRIENTQPLIYGGGALGAVAAARWKCQINENAKCPAYASPVPEVCHNELCAWGQHGDVTRQVNSIVAVRHDFENPQTAKRFEFIADAVSEAVAEIFTVQAAGDGELAQLFDLMVYGDLVSLWMAAEAGVDPGPVPVLHRLKVFLAQ